MTPTLRSYAILPLLAAAVTLTSCRQPLPPAAAVPVVPVATVGLATLSNDLSVTAEFRPYQAVDVMSKVAGYVRNINVDIGDQVRSGQVLATLEVPEMQSDVSRAKAGVAAAEANVATAQTAIDRAQAQTNIAALSYQRIQAVAMKDKGLVPRQEVDVAQSRQLEAAAQLASAQSTLQAAQQSGLQAQQEYARTQQMFEYTIIRAPFAGVITKRYANTGAMIQAGTASQSQAMPVVTLAQDSPLRLILPVPVTDVALIRDGQMADVVVASLHRTLHGTVTRSADAISTSTRTMDTEIDVPNVDGSLIPGMYAEVHLHLAARPDVLSVPLDAIDGLGTSVEQAYVVRDGIVHLVTVTTGLQTPSRIEVLSGLRAGDEVIVGRHTGLFDGEKVQPQPAGYEANHT
ncbi:RND family efflux transporter, MFP subunit [Bryocella elongata]|uniref:RND family efflux transporter, MFP subunit n=1 Tax=Bryocella elongata TaxID=863522 RepID=A0A1H5Z628_9BACT|nr:efflux RND transporter periplasmic adaptor subunit [Bryocella elongata]SEG31480.1 RND family efflux transporter, MFP subunit [Bryocella elongata]